MVPTAGLPTSEVFDISGPWWYPYSSRNL